MAIPTIEPTIEGHGLVGARVATDPESRLLPPRREGYDEEALRKLAESMKSEDTLHDGPDAEENLYVPAGYTYLGQFVDHDLTFDTTSSLDPRDTTPPSNRRTPRFDLDCLYGSGPADQPYMYENDGAKLRVGKKTKNGVAYDLLRVGDEGTERAVIGDKRNDENSIVCQIHLAFIKFHNAVVEAIQERDQLSGVELFRRAREEVRWTYQRVLVDDYLRRLIPQETYAAFYKEWKEDRDGAYKLYKREKWDQIPLEFSGAVYRFGHSMIRQGYRLNHKTALDILSDGNDPKKSLIGFQPLPRVHVIDDWRRFFPEDTPEPGQQIGKDEAKRTDKLNLGKIVRLQYAYKIDPTMANPLSHLADSIAGKDVLPKFLRGDEKGPSLQFLNLIRGNKFKLASGQTIAKVLGKEPLNSKYLCTRKKNKNGTSTFASIANVFHEDTPLWFYVLAEAQKPVIDYWIESKRDLTDDDFFSGPGALSQFGDVGSRIILEVFFGLLDADTDSCRYAEGWSPLIGEPVTMWKLLQFEKRTKGK